MVYLLSLDSGLSAFSFGQLVRAYMWGWIPGQTVHTADPIYLGM